MKTATVVMEDITIPTYTVGEPDKSPVFFDLRNHQGTRGSIYPLRMIDRLSSEKQDRVYHAVRLENEYIRVVLLPELGGRIYEGYDKKLNYHFVYHNRVIKPAMIGLAGAWVSGGIEFNWPQHHRPTTFMPVDAVIQKGPDGGQTVWMGEIEPIFGMKGMIGVSIDPYHSFLKVRARLYNPTEKVQTFHWWANLAVHTNDQYQLQFPPDVDYVTHHYKNVISPFPSVKGRFAVADFGTEGTDIRWYKNIEAPSSFFILNSRFNFMGGYDHERQCGTVHVADRHISPGKKFFTWGTGEFGKAWQKNLTDEDGPYIEIMTGVYTDNQPDFSFLQPYETKEFEQIWYATSQMPCLKNASAEGAVSLTAFRGTIEIGAMTTSCQADAHILLTCGETVLLHETASIAPGHTYTKQLPMPEGISEDDLTIQLKTADGRDLISYKKTPPYFSGKPDPLPHLPSKAPADIETAEELYLEGLQIEQYRHPLLRPNPYYTEGLRRDPMNVRLNLAMGMVYMRQAAFDKAEECFQKAVTRLTARNQNPYDCEAFYQLGVALLRQGRLNEADESFRKAAWDARWRAAALSQSAMISLALGQWEQALISAREAMKLNTEGLGLRWTACAALRHMGQILRAQALAEETIALDPLDYGSRFEHWLCMRETDTQAKAEESLNSLKEIIANRTIPWLQLAGQYIDAALWDEAHMVLDVAPLTTLRMLYLGYVLDKSGRPEDAEQYDLDAGFAKQDDCFPFTDRDLLILHHASLRHKAGGTAPYLLGLTYYGRGNRETAMEWFEEAVRREPSMAEARRCLAIGCHDVYGMTNDAYAEMRLAFTQNRSERYLLELLQVMKAAKVPMEERLTLLETHMDLTALRDDLYIEYVSLLNSLKRPADAAEALRSHIFHPYEGGEGLLLRQHILTHLSLGINALESGDALKALSFFEDAKACPAHYHEGRRYKSSEVHIDYHIACACLMLGDKARYMQALEACALSDAAMDETMIYKAMALGILGKKQQKEKLLHLMLQTAGEMITGKRNTYYGGYPAGLPFEQDLKKLDREKGWLLKALAYLGLGDQYQASASRNVLASLTDVSVFFSMVQSDLSNIPKL